jgi:hypothetical protein
MRIGRHREADSTSPLRRRPPPDYTQRSTKLKLFAMIAALMVVLAFAERVRDPKSWQWMWQATQTDKAAKPKFSNRLPDQPRTSHDPPGTFVSKADPADAPADADAQGLEIDPVQRAWDRGWKDVFDRLDGDRRALVFEMVHAGVTSGAIGPERQEAAAELLPEMTRLWEDYQAAAFQSVAQLKGDDQALWVDVLRQVNGRFNDEVRPALQAVIDGRPPSESEQQALAAFQQTLVELNRRRIQDDTVFRPAEREIWFYELGRVRDVPAEDLLKQSVGEVAYLQLFDQPEDYRGQIVTIEGTARLAYRVQAPSNYVGIEEYYIYWIHPAGGPSSPIVVYALGAPAGFPAIKDRDADRGTTKLHEEVRVTGVFFKRYAYLNKDGNATYTTPLILANTPEWKPAVQLVTADRLPASLGTIGAIVGGTLALALIVGVLFYRVASARSRRAKAAAREAEPASLGDLQMGPSTEENLRAMERDARSGRL